MIQDFFSITAREQSNSEKNFRSSISQQQTRSSSCCRLNPCSKLSANNGLLLQMVAPLFHYSSAARLTSETLWMRIRIRPVGYCWAIDEFLACLVKLGSQHPPHFYEFLRRGGQRVGAYASPHRLHPPPSLFLDCIVGSK